MSKHRYKETDPQAAWEHVTMLAVACGGNHVSVVKPPGLLGVYQFPTKAHARDFERRCKRTGYRPDVRDHDPFNSVAVWPR